MENALKNAADRRMFGKKPYSIGKHVLRILD